MPSTISGNYQDMLAKLYQKLVANMADYDFEEQAKRRLYEQNLHSGALGRERSLESSSINMADRGLNRSGIALQDHVGVNSAYDSKNAEAANALTGDLSSIARKRLEAETAYNLQKAELERQTALGSIVGGAVGGGGGGNSMGGYGGGSDPIVTSPGFGSVVSNLGKSKPPAGPSSTGLPGYGASQHPLPNKKKKNAASGGGPAMKIV